MVSPSNMASMVMTDVAGATIDRSHVASSDACPVVPALHRCHRRYYDTVQYSAHTHNVIKILYIT